MKVGPIFPACFGAEAGNTKAEETSTTFQALIFSSHLVDKFRSVPVRSQPSGEIQFIKISIEAFYDIDINYYSG